MGSFIVGCFNCDGFKSGRNYCDALVMVWFQPPPDRFSGVTKECLMVSVQTIPVTRVIKIHTNIQQMQYIFVLFCWFDVDLLFHKNIPTTYVDVLQKS